MAPLAPSHQCQSHPITTTKNVPGLARCPGGRVTPVDYVCLQDIANLGPPFTGDNFLALSFRDKSFNLKSIVQVGFSTHILVEPGREIL